MNVVGKTAPVIWLTGLSGAGKSTIAESVVEALMRAGHKVEPLDGDRIRELFPRTGFSSDERNAHVRRVGHLASLLSKHGVCVVVSLISPYRESRDFARNLCARFIEVHVSTPLEECERRDVKGLYAKARQGLLQHFTGIDESYEIPPNPELTVDTRYVSVAEATAQILAAIHRQL